MTSLTVYIGQISLEPFRRIQKFIGSRSSVVAVDNRGGTCNSRLTNIICCKLKGIPIFKTTRFYHISINQRIVLFILQVKIMHVMEDMISAIIKKLTVSNRNVSCYII